MELSLRERRIGDTIEKLILTVEEQTFSSVEEFHLCGQHRIMLGSP